MRKQEQDTVRQVLEAALKNLREEAGEGATSSGPGSLFPRRGSSSEGSGPDAPVIVVVAGELKACSHETTQQGSATLGDTDETARVNSPVSNHTERKLSHPGLERFTIEADSHPSVPKACFMEPGRACVNSGACEMRGF